MSIIQVENLEKKYRDFPAVNNLSFNVEKGEIFGLLGPNGAGKTTTIKILTAQLKPDGGMVRVLGYDPVKDGDRIKEKIGVVFEDQNFYNRLTVDQNLSFFAQLYGQSISRVSEVLEYVNLTHRRNDEAGKLSRGLKQRLVIARALLPSPEIIFLDEPTVGLDPHVAGEIRKIFMNLRSLGTTVFLTTHYMEEADEMCDRVAIINKGTIVKLDTPENLKKSLGPSILKISYEDRETFRMETLRFQANSPESAELLGRLTVEKIPFYIDTEKVSLEDVFIHYTGNQLDVSDPEATGAGSIMSG